MKTDWLKLPSTLALAGGLTLFVVEGHAEARTAAGATTVQAGQRWQPGSAPAAMGSAAQAPAAAPAARSDPAPTRAQLLAEVETLRNQKEALLREREALKQELEGGKPKRNYYRFDQSELLDAAKKGELRLRGYLMEDEPFALNDEAMRHNSLTPDERVKVEAIMRDSARRAHDGVVKLYVAMGGDANAASTLSVVALVNEIRTKSLAGEYPAAIRQLANERAGLVPAGDPASGTIVLRTFRLLMDEDPKVLDQVEALLGPRRAEAFFNGEGYPQSDHTFGVGPAEAKKR